MPEEGKISDHLANERTFLAWIRTSVGLMGFGFVVVKFSIFVRQISIVVDRTIPVSSHGYSSVMASGILINLLAVAILLIGIFLVIYLLRSI